MSSIQWIMPNGQCPMPNGSFDHTWFLLGRGRHWAMSIGQWGQWAVAWNSLRRAATYLITDYWLLITDYWNTELPSPG